MATVNHGAAAHHDKPRPKQTASDLMVRALEKEGVEYIFGVPGEENLDFVEALRFSKIKLIVTRHEQAAAFMAATVGRLTAKPGVCISTLGPGTLSFPRPPAETRATAADGRYVGCAVGTRRDEPGDRRGVRAAGRHAHGHDHRPEAHSAQQAGPLPGPRSTALLSCEGTQLLTDTRVSRPVCRSSTSSR